MPVTQRRSRKQLRHSIGQMLGALRQETGTVERMPTGTASNQSRIVDDALAFGVENEHRGRWIYATDSAGVGQTRRVTASSLDERTLTVAEPFSSVTGSSWRYELWDADAPPERVHEFINQAISGVTRKGAVNSIDGSFHTGGDVSAFEVTDSWTGVRDISWRSRYTGAQIASMDSPALAMSSNAIVESDTADFREGRAANRITITEAAGAGDALADAVFTSREARGFNRVEFWHKSSAPTTSSNLVIELRQGSSTHESLAIPATVENRWQYAVLEISSPEKNGSLDAVRIAVGSSDAGAVTAWIDDVKLSRANSETWHRVPAEFWSVNPADRSVILEPSARLPYTRLRVTGVRAPSLLTSDSQLCEIDSQYVINAAAAGVLRSRSDRRGPERDAAARQADLYEQLAQTMRLRMNTPSNIKWVDD